jgi:hypothetical protein
LSIGQLAESIESVWTKEDPDEEEDTMLEIEFELVLETVFEVVLEVELVLLEPFNVET